MNSFQPTADETYDIPTTPGSSLVSQLACARGSVFRSATKGEIDKRFGGLAALRSVELAKKIELMQK
jgi:hypothetical protein